MHPQDCVRGTLAVLAMTLLGVGDVLAQAGAQPPPLLPVTRLDERSTAIDLDAPRAVSLSISQPLPIREALLLLVIGTPFSIVVGEGVDGTFAGELKDLSLRQAIEAVLFPRSLDYTLDRTVIRVHTRQPVMRLFDVSYLNIRRSFQRSIRSSSALPGRGMAADTSTSVDGGFFDDIERGVTALLSRQGRAHVDRNNGVVQVTDVPERLDRIAVYLETIHMRAVRQVRFEAQVFEVKLTDPLARTIDWKLVAEQSGEAWPSVAGGAVGVKVADFSNVVRAIGQQGTIRMLASQQVVAMNNEPATMRVGTQDIYFTTSLPADGRDRITEPVSLHEGLTMTLVPQISADGIVQVSLSPTLTERAGEARSRQGERVPILRLAEADTLVRMRDGDTVLMSGFIQERTTTKEIEGIAGFFGSESTETANIELVILLKATVVAPSGPAAAGTR